MRLNNFVSRFKRIDILILSAIILFSTYFKLWHVNHLFKWIYDYDEGAYSLGGRFISNGFTPYQDFVLVHPPLYDLSLAFLYDIFGYDLFVGRYFSVFLSICCMALAFLIIRKFYNITAALIGAALIGLFPGFFLQWYRVVQEPLGICFILLAIFFLTDYISNKRIDWRLFVAGGFLGLALATKYTFLPAVAGIGISIYVLSLQGRWRILKNWINREIIYLGTGTLSGFFLVTGYFIINNSQEFWSQTVLSQISYRMAFDIEGVLHVLNPFQIIPSNIVISLCIWLTFVILAVITVKAKSRTSNLFLMICLLVSILISSQFNKFGEVRYFVTPFIFAILSLSSVIPNFDSNAFNQQLTIKTLKKFSSLLISLAIIITSTGGLLFLQRYDYTYMSGGKTTYEEKVYRQTLEYLEQHPDKKIYALSPIIPALANNIESSLAFDTFAFLEIYKYEPAEVLELQKQQGVGLIITDALRLLAFQKPVFGELAIEIIQNSNIVTSITPGELTIFTVNIYNFSD